MTDQNKLSRREAIKILGAATGASLLANLPSKWSRPEVTGSPLPAFAQTTCPGWTISVEWSSDVDVDLILIVPIFPNSFYVIQKGASGPPQGTFEPTTGAQHGGDVTSAGIETITVPNLIDGNWFVEINHNSDTNVPVTVSYSGFMTFSADFILPPFGQVDLEVNIDNCVGTIPPR